LARTTRGSPTPGKQANKILCPERSGTQEKVPEEIRIIQIVCHCINIASTSTDHQQFGIFGRPGLNSWAVIYSTLTTPPSSNLQFISRQNKSCEPAEYQSLSNQNLHPTHRVVSPIDHSTTEASPPNPSSPTTTCLCPRPAALTT